MMLDAVMLDLGCARPPLFAFPDASGLAPLTLPDEFLHGQSHQPQPEFPSDTVRRFETAMSAEPKLPSSVVECLMAHMISESPKTESRKPKVVSGDKPVVSMTERPTIVPTIETVEKPVIVAPTAKITVVPAVLENPDNRVKVDEPPVIASSTPITPAAKPVAEVETPLAVDRPMGTSVEQPVSVAVEGSAVASASTPIHEGSVVRSAERPVVATVERPEVVSGDKPAVSMTERPMVATVEVPTVVTVEKPVIAAPTVRATVVPAVLENLNSRVKVEAPSVIASSTPISPAAKPVAMVETPVTVDRSMGTSVEHSVRVAVEGLVIASVNPMIQEGSVVRSADERPMATTVERPVVVAPDKPTVVTLEKPVVVAPDKPVVETVERPVVVAPDKPTAVTVERPVVVTPDKPTVVAVERPVVVAPDKPVVETVERPVVVTPDKPTVVAVERPVVVAPDKPVVETAEKTVDIATPVAPTVVPPVQENSNDTLKAEGHPVVVSSTPTIPDAPATRSDVMVEAPVAVEKPFVAPSDNAKIQVIVTKSEEPDVISEKTPVMSAERPVVAKVSNPKVAAVDKPEEKAVAVAAHVVVAPPAVETSAQQVLQAAPEVAAASARTEAIVETVNQIVEAVVGQILVTPGITHGECEIKIMLKPTVLDGSEITMSAKDGTLTVGITPATQEASAAAVAALPRLEIALAEHAPAFHHISVALQLKKGNRNEAV